MNANVSTPASTNSISNTSLDNRARLSYQLIQPRLDHRAAAAFVDIEAMGGDPGGCPSIDTRKRTGNRPRPQRPHHEMQVAGVKAAHRPSPVILWSTAACSPRSAESPSSASDLVVTIAGWPRHVTMTHFLIAQRPEPLRAVLAEKEFPETSTRPFHRRHAVHAGSSITAAPPRAALDAPRPVSVEQHRPSPPSYSPSPK